MESLSILTQKEVPWRPVGQPWNYAEVCSLNINALILQLLIALFMYKLCVCVHAHAEKKREIEQNRIFLFAINLLKGFLNLNFGE